MGRFWLAASLVSCTMLAACAATPEPTPAQMTIVQPGIDAERQGNYGFALFTYRYWANWGVGPAQYRLARLYEQGLGTDQDDAEAATWYRAASDNGYAPARLALARLYDEGRGVPQDHAAAFDLYQKAAAGGDVDARDLDGLQRGHGTAADASGAPRKLVALNAADMDADSVRADPYGPGPGAVKTAPLAPPSYKAAAAGDPRARLRLARMDAPGDGAERDEGRSVEPSGSKIEGARAPDVVRLGNLQPALAPTPVDAAGVVQENRQEAQRGDGAAAFKVGEAFERGQGVPPDLVEALAWYEIADRQGHAPAAARVEELAGALPNVEVEEAGRRVDLWWERFGS